VASRALRKLDVQEYLVRGVMIIYANVKKMVKTKHGYSEGEWC